MQEIWKDIRGYEGLYQVSNLGNVKRLKGKWVKKERYVSQTLTSSYKYYSVCLSNHQEKRRFFVHRLVAMTFIKNTENKPIINHIDGNKLNNPILFDKASKKFFDDSVNLYYYENFQIIDEKMLKLIEKIIKRLMN